MLETIEAHMLREGTIPQLVALHRQVEEVKTFLEEQQTKFFRHLRKQVGNAPEPVQVFQNQLTHYFAWPAPQTSRQQEHLETFLMRYLLPWPIPAPTLERERDMVGYHPTPIRILLDLYKQADFQSDDVFYDIGAGLGHVALLVHLLTGIQARGVEIEPAYYHYACRLVDKLRLSSVDFLNADARDVGYADGSVFFLYTPFQDTLLHEVLQKIRYNTRGHNIRLYALGPCTLQIAKQNWLHRLDQHGDRVYELAAFQRV
jgi:SAM-dependent methyltransferase